MFESLNCVPFTYFKHQSFLCFGYYFNVLAVCDYRFFDRLKMDRFNFFFCVLVAAMDSFVIDSTFGLHVFRIIHKFNQRIFLDLLDVFIVTSDILFCGGSIMEFKGFSRN